MGLLYSGSVQIVQSGDWPSSGRDQMVQCIALWLQDDGHCRVVHLGSEGQNLFVLARDMRDFLLLLAVGYF